LLKKLGVCCSLCKWLSRNSSAKGEVKLQGSDASHAWVSVYVPEMGWCEFDPTNNIISGERHLLLPMGVITPIFPH
jgi:transglutaminase-like putative cysteine protease